MKSSHPVLKPYERRLYGDWGESFVDQSLGHLGWSVYQRNIRLRRGEIDRVYKSHTSLAKRFCICEIKTIQVKNDTQFQSIFSELSFKRFIKNRQMTNLHRYGMHLRAHKTGPDQTVNVRCFLRVFLVICCPMEVLQNLENDPFLKRYTVRVHPKGAILLSFAPEISWGQSTSATMTSIV